MHEQLSLSPYAAMQPYFGDIHNHCDVGYGHGRLADSWRNARMQLDFAAISVHAHWPDIPVEMPHLADLVAYHERGFARTAAAWERVRQSVAENYVPGEFVTFLAFEWHSREYGDHNIYFNGDEGEIIRAGSLAELRAELRKLNGNGLMLPHHIGYKQGHRGINWGTFDPELSPVVEIMSMHGAAEAADTAYPYLHTMGPRDWQSTYQYGLAQGHIVGAVGSTDHHSAHPGSYGHGRLAVFAPELTRDAIWNAIRARRTIALTGDNIVVGFSVNGGLVGDVLPAADTREIEVEVIGGGAIDYVELLHNNRVIHRESVYATEPAVREAPYKIHLEMGWGLQGENVDWRGEVGVRDGRLLAVEPRFRGHNIVAPQAGEKESYAFSAWERCGASDVQFTTRTWGNPTTTTAGTQGLCLQLAGDGATALTGAINGHQFAVPLAELVSGPKAIYLHNQFMAPAFYFQRAVPAAEYRCAFSLEHQPASGLRDWYTVRVRQRNGQWAWSSPIWVEA